MKTAREVAIQQLIDIGKRFVEAHDAWYGAWRNEHCAVCGRPHRATDPYAFNNVCAEHDDMRTMFDLRTGMRQRGMGEPARPKDFWDNLSQLW